MTLHEKVEQAIEALEKQPAEGMEVSLSYFDLLQIRKGLHMGEEMHKQLKQQVQDQNVYRKKLRNQQA